MSICRISVAGAAVLSFSSAAVLAAPPQAPDSDRPLGRIFGRGAPFAISDLPPSVLRSRLEALPEGIRARALDWLHDFEFPDTDTHFLRVDAEGAVYYEDLMPPPEDLAESESAQPDPASLPAEAVDNPFALHSRLGAATSVYLDFDGHTISGTAWNASTGTSVLVGRAFDLDNNPGNFNTAERAAIAEIWHRVAEDFAAFDIDVTTEEPAGFGPTVGRILITSRTDANGKAMPASGAGGVAYVNVFGTSSYASYYSPALVYYDNLGKLSYVIADAASHEFGHNLGLSHDGSASTAYYGGHGSGAISWGPIMGSSSQRSVTQWSKGEYAGANNRQDDIAIIAAKLGFGDDDHGDAPAEATALAISADGEVRATDPETDPDNLYPENKGVIGRLGDRDLFRIDADAGTVDLRVNPAWQAFYRSDRRNANLDLRAVLSDARGTTIAESNPAADTYAEVSANLAAGVYYLEVSAVGSANYSDYASQGQYFISGEVTPGSVGNLPPTAAFDHLCSGLACSFADRSADSDGQVVSWQWDFGDGGSSTERNPTHSYASPGAYTVRLTVRDDAGSSASATATATPAESANNPPTASFVPYCFRTRCWLIDRSTDSDGSIRAWAWDFGDGTRSTLRSPAHTFAAPGTYSVTLTVTDDGTPAQSASVTQEVNAGVRTTSR